MKAEEKAIDLLSKINNQQITPEIWDNASKGAKSDLKRKVHIIIDEILKAVAPIDWGENESRIDFSNYFKYWEEVKSELGKM